MLTAMEKVFFSDILSLCIPLVQVFCGMIIHCFHAVTSVCLLTGSVTWKKS